MNPEDLDGEQKERMAAIGMNVGYLLHQVRSPVTTIGMLAHSIRKKADLEGPNREKMDQLLQQVSDLEDMLQECMDYVRPPSGEGARVNVPNLLRWTAEQVQPQAEKRDVSLEVDAPRDVPSVCGHLRLLRQALLNVVENAVEAAAEGKRLVSLSAHATSQRVVIEVADTGTGLSEEETERVFEPFYTTKKQGSGLGLAFVRKVVEDHGGRAEVKSRPGQGTTVALRLPKAQ
ncbi:MAG: sensor histidine kinase [bacterium]